MKLKVLLGVLLALVLVVGIAQEGAQEPVTITVAESDEYGSYLVDGEGRSLYLFMNEEAEAGAERMTEGVRPNAQPCIEGCLQAWPPLTGEAMAGEGIDAELLYTAEFEGLDMVVYNGWPLYYFVQDMEAGQTNGQGRGSAPTIWYLVSPDGNPITGE